MCVSLVVLTDLQSLIVNKLLSLSLSLTLPISISLSLHDVFAPKLPPVERAVVLGRRRPLSLRSRKPQVGQRTEVSSSREERRLQQQRGLLKPRLAGRTEVSRRFVSRGSNVT
jgi:hypothetical protein